MSMSIARFPSGPLCEAELDRLGFHKEEVWLKWSAAPADEAEMELHQMRNKPMQFAAFDFWGAGPD